MQPPLDDTAQLKNLTESGKPPKTRMNSASAVRQMWGMTDGTYERRFRRDALVKGLVDGNRPFDQSKLRDSGQQYRANFSNGEAESFLNTAVTAFYDLFSEVDRFANCQVDPELDQANQWSDIISREFDSLLRKNDRLDYNIQLSFHDMVLYGIGPMIWEDELDWRARAVNHYRLRVPDGTPSNVCDWEFCFVECNYRVDEMYAMIADPETAKKRGYDVAQIKEAIQNALPLSIRNMAADSPLKWQEWIRNNECRAGMESKVVRCVRFFYREFPKDDDGYGTVSEMLVWLDGNTSSTEDKPLYHAIDVYEDWRNALCAFFWDRGDGTAHSVRGLGVKMFHLLHAKNRLQCAQYDAATMSMTLKFKAVGSSQSQQLSVSNLGPCQVFQGPYEPIPTSGANNLGPSLEVSTDIERTLNSNLGQYRQSPDKQTGNPRTAFEVNAELQRQSVLAKTQISRFYQQLDEFYQETFRRSASEKIPKSTKNRWLLMALEFQERCQARGIPLEILRKAKVTARRTSGQGSAYMRALSLGQLYRTVFPVLPFDGKSNLTDDLIAATAGREAVSRYNPVPMARTKEAQQAWEAQIENDSLRNRGAITLTPYQNDIIHAQEHLAFGSQASQSLQAGASPVDVLGILEAIGKHTAQHLQRINGNPVYAREARALTAQWKQMGQIADQIEGLLKKQAQAAQQAQMTNQQAQQIQQGQDPETNLKAAEMQAKLQLKAQKQQGDMALKARKQQQDNELKRQQALADQALKDAETAAGIRLDTAKTASNIRLNNISTAAETLPIEEPIPEEQPGF